MKELLSVNNIAFTLLGYPMSYVELAGTLLYLLSVWLIAKRRTLTWPVGIISVLLFMTLFYQVRLYSDAIEQIYYLFISVFGWWSWVQSPQKGGAILHVRFSPSKQALIIFLLTAAIGAATGVLMSRIHLFLPALFPEAASFPYLDAITTIMSFTAMWLMAKRRIESWIYWITVDIVAIGLYYTKEIRFVALLYVLLLFLAIKGLVEWIKAPVRANEVSQDTLDGAQ